MANRAIEELELKLDGEQVIEADRTAVWRALKDPEILKACIPGCETLDQQGENRFSAVVAIKVGPIGARFTGTVELSDLIEPSSYRLTGQGQGGVAGSAKGSALVHLEEDGARTKLSYSVEAQVGGRIAQLGGAIIEATARQLAARFFTRFAQEVTAASAPVKSAETTAPVAYDPATNSAKTGAPKTSANAGPALSGFSTPLLLIALLAAYVLGVFQARADLSGRDSMVVMALLAIVALAARLSAGRGGRGGGQ